MQYTDGRPTPDIFRLWSGITAVAGAMERRCWCVTSRIEIFPNLYVLLVGPPSSGKTQAIMPAADFWNAAKSLFVGANSLTSAAFVDSLMAADRKLVTPEGLMEYHSLQIACGELGVLVSQHDLEFLSNLNDIYDNPKTYRQKRRHMNGGKEIQIIKPQLTLLAGTQPGFMSSLLPDEAWSMGTMSRMIMIYGHAAPIRPLFGDHSPMTELHKKLSAAMHRMTEVRGQFQWEPAVQVELEAWHLTRLAPIPTHSKLTHYNGRRIMHLLKLCMVAAVSRTRDELVIRIGDFERARGWLLSAERFMPDIFREMVLKSDHETIMELHFFLWGQYLRNGKKSMHESLLYSFLSNRAAVDKIPRIIETAVRSDVIVREAGSIPMYYPKPKLDTLIE